MIADGLTKALPEQKWQKFMDQLNMEDIRNRDKRETPITCSWETLEDSLDGGESDTWIPDD